MIEKKLVFLILTFKLKYHTNFIIGNYYKISWTNNIEQLERLWQYPLYAEIIKNHTRAEFGAGVLFAQEARTLVVSGAPPLAIS